MSGTTTSHDDATTTPASPGTDGPRRGRWPAALSFTNVGAIYVWLAIIVFFAFLAPETFPTVTTLRTILNNEAVTGLVALALVIPLAAGVFDLSVGYLAGFSGVFVAFLLANTEMTWWLAALITLLAALVIGAVNAVVVVFLKVNSLIGTLGTGAIIFAFTKWVSDEQIITTRVPELSEAVARNQAWGITAPVLYLVVVMLVIGYVLEQTKTGRRWYAIGFDPEVSRLVGTKVRLLQTNAFLISAVVSSMAGIIMTARIGSASPEAGPSYLLPAFAAAFLGATQFRKGRFNVWGAVVAVLLLGTGRVGLSLAGAPTWAPDIFQGVVLITAMAITQFERKAKV